VAVVEHWEKASLACSVGYAVELYATFTVPVLATLDLVTTIALLPVVFMVFGASQKICVSLTTVKLAQSVPPMVTAVAPVKPEPTIVKAGPDSVPAIVLAKLGETKVTLAGVIYVYPPVLVTVPPHVVTTTFFAPAVLAGVVQ
jgi:hypothetical protein